MTTGIEQDALRKYSKSEVYNECTITRSLEVSTSDWGSRLLAIKAETLRARVRGRRVLDIGCANGRHLAELADSIARGVGVDFAPRFIEAAKRDFASLTNLSFFVADARDIPLEDASVDIAYSFATLYYIDDIENAYKEIARLLVPGGVAVLELGNANSLATRIARNPQNAHLAQHSKRVIGDHLSALSGAGLGVKSHRAFQILPMWGSISGLLSWTRHPLLDALMNKMVFGRMIDEWVSNLPGLKGLAFRHLIVVEKLD
ncbi:class I SAM-dependent methyltransferase [Bradyrhizobium sediminis]|uniref:Class I SAM-dependent methyltransferase n=1 Tax=Bradyrhizobium sediminis TaxID=2840469 RepID=A0A975P3U1_9BRAD|nr:class I SAM-dependent methyltransferase [Bradyrhizobium sediminis]QWG25099.1 class I SAM-dependent methyltransferase [Bradyrhizobium sediminis]